MDLPSGPTEFRTTSVKPYLIEVTDNDERIEHIVETENNNQPPTKTLADPQPQTRPVRLRRPTVRYQNITNVSNFLQDESTPAPFVESRRKEINGL